MKLSVSQLAWKDPVRNFDAAKILIDNGIDCIDILPGKYSTSAEILSEFVEPFAFRFAGAQSLLFGCTDNIFGSDQERDRVADRLEKVFKLCAECGARRLTFGSPKNRDIRGMNPVDARLMAIEYFQRLGTLAAKYSVFLCLEPNPTIYGCNFMTTTHEAAEIVLAVNDLNVWLQLDLGCVTANKEDLREICKEWRYIVGHIHISEPHLAPIQDHAGRHARYAAILNEYFPNRTATIEVIHKSDGQPIEMIESIAAAKTYYRT